MKEQELVRRRGRRMRRTVFILEPANRRDYQDRIRTRGARRIGGGIASRESLDVLVDDNFRRSSAAMT